MNEIVESVEVVLARLVDRQDASDAETSDVTRQFVEDLARMVD
jgi:hypothetical protein